MLHLFFLKENHFKFSVKHYLETLNFINQNIICKFIFQSEFFLKYKSDFFNTKSTNTYISANKFTL